MRDGIGKKLCSVMVVFGMLFSLFGCGAKTAEAYYPDWVFDNLRAENAALAEGANVRIMSANVLVHIKSWGGTPVAPRAQQFSEMLKHYQPDVVALQELCADWHTLLMPQIGDTYTLMDEKKSDYTNMIYNSKTVKLLDSGVLRYSKESNKRCRYVVWGIFERLDGGERFAVTSTHWDLGMEEKKVEMRNTQIEELNSLVRQLEQDYQVPVFAAGDYNALEKDVENAAESYQKFLKISEMADAKFSENLMLNIGPNTTFEEESWDHIFIKGAINPLGFTILANDFYESMSDHYMIFLDAKV